MASNNPTIDGPAKSGLDLSNKSKKIQQPSAILQNWSGVAPPQTSTRNSTNDTHGEVDGPSTNEDSEFGSGFNLTTIYNNLTTNEIFYNDLMEVSSHPEGNQIKNNNQITSAASVSHRLHSRLNENIGGIDIPLPKQITNQQSNIITTTGHPSYERQA